MVSTADQLIEGIHYEKGSSPAKIAKKLIRRNMSDIAACGGAFSLFALCTVALGERVVDNHKWFNEFFCSLGREAKKWNLSICGGDIAKIASGENTVLSMTIVGETSEKRLCRRSGAEDGDILFCTGEFGNSFRSGHHLDFEPRIKEAEFLAGKYSNTMIDVSDGFLLDAGRLAEASGRSLILSTEALRLRDGATLKSALSEGEDYELLFAVSKRKSKTLMKTWPFKTKLTAVGTFALGKVGRVFDLRGVDLIAKYGGGYEHF